MQTTLGLLLGGLMALFSGWFFQSTPPTVKVLGMYSPSGAGNDWTPLTGSGTTGQITYTPDRVALYADNGAGAFIPWTGSSGGGAPSGPAGGDLGSTYPNPTVLNLTHATNAALTTTLTATINSAGSFTTPISAIVPNMTTGQTAQIGFGHDGTTNHEAFLGMTYDSSTGNNNQIRLGFFGAAAAMTINPDQASFSIPLNLGSGIKAGYYQSTVNCNSSASPAVCSTAPSGSVVIAAAATTVQVNTAAVGSNSQILVTPDASLGTRLGVTCNTTIPQTWVSARSSGTSFTISAASAPTTNPLCLSFSIMNF